MPVVAVVNRKGGCGKSTLAAHIAAWCARNGSSVMLGDVDKQQSTRAWLRRRSSELPLIAPWAVDQQMLRVPSGITHVVLDTPGGLRGFELAKVVMFADAIIMPVCHSAFDRESAAACHAELMALPRVASGRCHLAAVGMRIDSRTNAAQTLRDWAAELHLEFLGVLRETQVYVRSLERGLTVFDLPAKEASQDLAQWQPIVDWMTPLLHPVQAANDPAPAREPAQVTASALKPASSAPSPVLKSSQRLGSSRPNSLMPAQESLVHGGRLSVFGAGGAPSAEPVAKEHRPALPAKVAAETLTIPSFLKRQG